MNAPEPQKDHRLSLTEVVNALMASGEITAEEGEKFKQDRRYYQGDAHPLVVIAGQRWKSAKSDTLLDLPALTQWLADWSGLPYFHIDPLKINFSIVTEVMSNAYAIRFRVLPIEVRANEVVIATSEPFERGWEEELKPALRKDIRRVVASPEDIARFQVEFYNLAKSVKGAMARGGMGSSGISNFEQLVELGQKNKSIDANDQHVVLIVDWLWQYAFEQRASDIHVEPRREFGIVRFRIDGIMHQVYQVPVGVLNAMTSRIKILGRMDVVEKRRPQDGRIKTRTPDGQEVELRLSTLPTAFGEKLVMRIFDPDVLVRDFSALGFSTDDSSRWGGMTSQPGGIILVTGPTGSGKTTTLYSTLKQLATPEVNLSTLEDPIEMVEPAFNQVQIQSEIGMGFAEGIRALMRQDPDIIMVGEIRDLETAEMAIQAALTGHLVLSTLHTNDAPSAITRLLDLGVPSYLIQSTLLGVMAQRLVRTLCPHCKKAGGLRVEDETSWKALVRPWKTAMPATLYHPQGCLECRRTGYQGRLGLYEIMLMSESLKELVTERTDIARLRDQAMREGMQPLRISGARKIAAGLTTIEEVVKVAPPPPPETNG